MLFKAMGGKLCTGNQSPRQCYRHPEPGTAAGQMLNVSFVSETEDCKDTRGCDGRGGGIYMLDG